MYSNLEIRQGLMYEISWFRAEGQDLGKSLMCM